MAIIFVIMSAVSMALGLITTYKFYRSAYESDPMSEVTVWLIVSTVAWLLAMMFSVAGYLEL